MTRTNQDNPTAEVPRYIESKLATGRFKDLAEIVELICRIRLDEDFALQLDPSVRSIYKQCFDQANDPNYDGVSQP